MKLLKGRPEIDRLFKKLRAENDGVFDFLVFLKFMREKQKVPPHFPSCLSPLTEKFSLHFLTLSFWLSSTSTRRLNRLVLKPQTASRGER